MEEILHISRKELEDLISSRMVNVLAENELLKKWIKENHFFSDLLKDEVLDIQILIENTNDTIWLMDLNFSTIWVNPNGRLNNGFSMDELKELPFSERLTADSYAKAQKLIAENLTPENISNPNSKISINQEFEFYSKNRDTYWLETKISMIRNKLGKPSGYIGIGRDITSQKRFQDALAKSEEKFSKAFRSSPICLALTRLSDGMYLDVNDTLLNTIGYTRDEFIGQTSHQLGLWANQERFMEFLSQFRQRGSIRNFETTFITKSRQIVYVEVSSDIILIDGQQCILTTSVDISERKAVEERLKRSEQDLRQQNIRYAQLNEELFNSNREVKKINKELFKAKENAEEADRLKSAFLANMSHEIRTPMNAILGFSQLLENQELPREKQVKFTKTIQDRAVDLLGIINDIIDISKIESGTLSLYEESCDLGALLEDIQQFFKSRNENLLKKPIDFILDNQLDKSQKKVVLDSVRLKQILINLIENAFKFTHQGIIELGCEVQGANLRFRVKDTGIGISKDKQSIIFNRFRQADEQLNTRKYGGTGLGLSISKGLVELMNGKIWLVSQPNKGTTFTFELPLSINTNVELPVPEDHETAYNWSNKSILIVEDVHYNSILIKEFLDATGVKLLFASNAQAALELFNKYLEIDLVLLDIRLPDNSGFDVVRSMRAKRSDVIVIAQTAYAGEYDRQKCLEAGCNDYISKPIMEKVLFETLSKYLR